ncbi:nuclease (SNase domain protein) [Solidesulfovibrio fructosivorans JJ]]|uniref:Nuclease (SNase domain protein) n=1 Tax=Solidesulfovibrio fructosivorans JJ] TaxID=596151 RepID=E1JWL5_SOLFR|nr:thermonuclease family protein [Solidesulfovibrio fructosivorans]EFL51312.1 nuclease (SNase domain protein) [Solidesulfovibrio fructosivorans JJ]]
MFLAAFAVLLLLFAPRPGAARDAVSVARVFDGDTVRLADGRTVRLAGIDAPEVAHGLAPAQYYADASKRGLERLTRGRTLRFVPVGAGRDRFGRALGDLLLPDGASVAEGMVASGAAFVFWYRDLPKPLVRRLLAAQRRAMAQGRGFWPRILRLPPPVGGYVGNAASHRFHVPGCPDAARIGRRNRLVLADAGQAFARGFSPARGCTPWPPAGSVAESRRTDKP